jgi:hypothetical protein
LAVIPIGCTGSTAAALHKRVLDKFSDYFPTAGYKRSFQDLNKKATVRQMVERIVAFIEKLKDYRAVRAS